MHSPGRISPLNTFLMEQFSSFPFPFTCLTVDFFLPICASQQCRSDFFFSSILTLYSLLNSGAEHGLDFPSLIGHFWKRQYDQVITTVSQSETQVGSFQSFTLQQIYLIHRLLFIPPEALLARS